MGSSPCGGKGAKSLVVEVRGQSLWLWGLRLRGKVPGGGMGAKFLVVGVQGAKILVVGVKGQNLWLWRSRGQSPWWWMLGADPFVGSRGQSPWWWVPGGKVPGGEGYGCQLSSPRKLFVY